MDCIKIGALIQSLRKEKNMTQKELADQMNISDKTISKWERGKGCPDIGLLGDLSDILGVNMEKILMGTLEEKDINAGNLKNIKFYVCKSCGNVVNSIGEVEISCCGRKVKPLISKVEDQDYKINITDLGNEYYIEIDHPMLKTNYISFVAFVGYDKFIITKLYPEQSPELYFNKMQGGKLYVYSCVHGLWEKRL